MYSLSSNMFRVLDKVNFKKFMDLVIIDDLKVYEHNVCNEIYFSFQGSSDLKGISTNSKVTRLNFYSFSEKLQEFLVPDDRIVIKKISEDNAQAVLISKNNINGVDFNTEVLQAFKKLV